MDIFEQSDAFTPSREVLQEEEEAAKPSAESYLRPALCVWNKNLVKQLYPGGVSCHILVVATCPTSCALIRALPGKQLLGSVLAPGVSLAGNSLASAAPGESGQPLPSDKVCTVYSLRSQPPAEEAAVKSSLDPCDDVIFVCCQYEVARERAPAWARAVLGQMTFLHAVFLGSMPAEQFRGQGDASQEELIFALRTRASQQALKSGTQPAVPLLPTGTVVGGLPAALLSYCQARGLSAELIVMVEMVLEGRPALVEALARALGALLRGRGADPVALGVCNRVVLVVACKELGLRFTLGAGMEVYV